jgi:ubiquitin-conjugating enzyme E2 O
VLAVLRNPPRHFEGLITQHFLERGSGFLSACDAYLDGCPIGEYVEGWKEALQADNEASPKDTESSATKSETPETETSSATPPSSKRKRVKPPPSAGFKLALRKLLPKLVMAFETNRGDKK